MKKKKEAKRYFDVGKDLDITLLKRIILLIDGYLVCHFKSAEFFKEKVKEGKVGREISHEWEKIEDSLLNIRKVIASIPGVDRLLKIQSLTQIASLCFLMASVVLVTSTMIMQIPISTFYQFYLIIIWGALALITISYIASQKADRIIRNHFEHEDLKKLYEHKYLQKTVQRLLYTLSYYFKVHGIDPSKHPLELYNSDYDGINIKKTPGLFRRTYQVIVSN